MNSRCIPHHTISCIQSSIHYCWLPTQHYLCIYVIMKISWTVSGLQMLVSCFRACLITCFIAYPLSCSLISGLVCIEYHFFVYRWLQGIIFFPKWQISLIRLVGCYSQSAKNLLARTFYRMCKMDLLCQSLDGVIAIAGMCIHE